MIAANCADDGLFATQKSGPAVEFGFFLTGIILTSIVGEARVDGVCCD